VGEEASLRISSGLFLVVGLLILGILAIYYVWIEPGRVDSINQTRSITPASGNCTVSGNSGGGIGSVVESPSDTFTMEFAPGSGGLWFHIKLSDCRDRNMNFILKMTRDLDNNSAHWYDGERRNTPVASHDRRTWEIIKTGSLDKRSRTFTFNYTPAHDEEWIAYFYPFTDRQLDEFLRNYSTSPHIRTEVIGNTPMGRKQVMVTITDAGVPDANKKVVLLIFREDAWETLGTYNAAGTIKYLLSNDSLAVSLRKNVIFKLVPIVSVDGVVEDSLLGVGYDANPDHSIYLTSTWMNEPSPKEIENIKQQVRDWKSSGKRIDLAGRYHSWGFQSIENVFGVSNERLKNSAKKYLPDAMMESASRGGRFPDFLMTLYPDITYFDTEETAVGTSIEDAENFGIDTIKIIADYLGINPASVPPQQVNFTHPGMYLSQEEIEAIKAKVNANEEPLKTAYDRMISAGNLALVDEPASITYGGREPPSGDKHDYFSDPPYTSDGIFDPKADRSDYESAIRMGKGVRDLGLAYAFTGETKYADKALQFIRAWTLDPVTGMNPKFTDWQSNIEISITLPGMFYGADLIWDYKGWDPADREAFRSWTWKMIESAKAWQSENNYENWRLVFISSASVVAEDPGSRKYAFERWKSIIRDQMAGNGSMVKETGRTNSLTYSLYAVNAMMQTAEIARHFGVDLYNYRLPDGRSLEKALDFYAPYAADPQAWKYNQITAYAGDNAALYELAYSFRQKPAYKDIITKWRQPMYESRVMGPVTLTHSSGTYPFTISGRRSG